MTQAPSSLPIESDAAPSIATADVQMEANLPEGLAADDMVEVCRQMILVRTMDERIWMMNRQGKVPIAASCQGHEAAELGSLLAAQKDGDCFLFPYYRDLALKMAAGLTPRQVMLSFMEKRVSRTRVPGNSPCRARISPAASSRFPTWWRPV